MPWVSWVQKGKGLFNVLVDYPTEDEEFQIVRQTTAETTLQISKSLSQQEIGALQQFVRRVPVADHVIRYAMQFTRLSRNRSPDTPDFVRKYVSWGAGPRASQYLVLGAKARAVLHGRTFASTEDVRAVARPVLRHRLMTNFNAEAEGIRPDTIIERLIELIPHDAKALNRLPSPEPLSRGA